MSRSCSSETPVAFVELAGTLGRGGSSSTGTALDSEGSKANPCSFMVIAGAQGWAIAHIYEERGEQVAVQPKGERLWRCYPAIATQESRDSTLERRHVGAFVDLQQVLDAAHAPHGGRRRQHIVQFRRQHRSAQDDSAARRAHLD